MNLTPADEIIVHCQVKGYPKPVREHLFASRIRNWAFDLAWVELKIAIEIEGGVFGGKPCPTCGQRVGGRHNRGATFRNDTMKYNEAAIRGWRVLRVLPEQVKSGMALGWIDRLLTREV